VLDTVLLSEGLQQTAPPANPPYNYQNPNQNPQKPAVLPGSYNKNLDTIIQQQLAE
jgi:hypothetical protein